MKKLFRKFLAVIMVIIMTLTATPVVGFKAEAAKITELGVGNVIEFGWYPQSKVTDSATIAALNAIDGEWISYGYFSGSGSELKSVDYMRYKDVIYGSDKYRAVIFDYYRKNNGGFTQYSDIRYADGRVFGNDSSQDNNGYITGNVYWFKYEPIEWRVLEPATGLVIAETIIDAQPFNYYSLSSGTDEYGQTAYWGDLAKTHYANNYAESSIRKWLNDDFYNTAFSSEQQSLIEYTLLDNSACSSFSRTAYDSETTNDKIFLLSCACNYSFDSSVTKRSLGEPTDYAEIQGSRDIYWWLRTPRDYSNAVCRRGNNWNGVAGTCDDVVYINGILPSLKLNLYSDIFQAKHIKTHVVNDYQTQNASYATEYLANAAVPMDGSNGTADLCIPGLSLGENMVPQGVAYYKAKNQLLISSYYKDAKTSSTPCYIFALDMATGEIVGEYKIKEPDGTDLSAHVGGIAVSDYNLYITGNDADICKVSLSQLTGKSGEIKIEDKCSVSDWLGDANTAYLSIDGGTLVTGNFYYSKNSDYNTPAKAAKSVIITHSLSGNSAEEEWNNLCSFSRLSVVKVPDSVDRIQGVAYRDGKFYISSSFGRKNTSTLYIADWSGNTLKNISDYTALPMMEEITFVGDYIYAVFESGSAFYFEGLDGGGKSKDPTDVLWKIDYKELIDIYNLGDETYNFENFSDADSDGHCFGMSMTSAGYHTRKLDISTIGGNRRNGLYVLSGTSTVKEPICYYQDIQAKYSKNAIVAGGSSYTSWFGFSDIDSDWKEVINYVKNHKYDNKGTLQIGYRKNGEGGHAINFLRYEVVDGQERIYAYDNNFPDTEVYFYKNSSGDIVQAPFATFSGAIDCIALRSVEKYFNSVGDYNATRYIYADKDDISIPGAEVYYVDCGTVSRERVVFEIPEGEEKVTIIPLVENAEFEYLDVYYSFENAENGKVGEFVLAEDENSAGNSVSLTFIEYPWEIDITTPSVSTINYGDTLVLHAELAETALPEGYSILWTVEGTGVDLRQSTDGLTCEVTSVQNGNVTVKATIVDENGEALIDIEGNEISAEQNLNSKVNFWQKIVSFLKNLFRISRIILQSK